LLYGAIMEFCTAVMPPHRSRLSWVELQLNDELVPEELSKGNGKSSLYQQPSAAAEGRAKQ